MAQVTAVRQVKTHQPLVRPHDGLICLQIGRAAAQALDIDAPLLGVQPEGLKGALLAEKLHRINVLVAAVVSCTRVPLGVLIRHGRAESVEDGAGGDILGGDEEDRLALALDLFFLVTISILRELQCIEGAYHDLSDLRISFH